MKRKRHRILALLLTALLLTVLLPTAVLAENGEQSEMPELEITEQNPNEVEEIEDEDSEEQPAVVEEEEEIPLQTMIVENDLSLVETNLEIAEEASLTDAIDDNVIETNRGDALISPLSIIGGVYTYDDPNGNLQSLVEADLGGPPYDYSVVTKLKLSGVVLAADYNFIRFSLVSLAEVDVAGVTSAFPVDAFWQHTGITTAIVSPTNPLSEKMFNGCTNLKTLSVGAATPVEGVIDLTGYTASSYGKSVFLNCTSIEKVRIPANRPLSTTMFEGCSGLTTLSVGANAFEDDVIDLNGFGSNYGGNRAFYLCTGIQTVKLPADVSIAQGTFEGCSNLKTLGIGTDAPTENVVDLTGYTATPVGDFAFADCNSIQTVKLPTNVALSAGIFGSCDNLKTLSVGSNEPTPNVVDLSNYTAGAFGVMSFSGSGIQTVIMPDTNINIPSAMFEYCDSLQAVIFNDPNAPAAIAANAFDDPNNVIAYVPNKAAGGYELASFKDHFLDVKSNEPPAFIQHPQSLTVFEGETASMTIELADSPIPYTLQWQVSEDNGSTWTDLVGETTETLAFTASYAQNGYQYRCVATNLVDSTISNEATLTVNVLVTDITIVGGNSISTQNGTLQLTADVLPVNATNKNITWSNGGTDHVATVDQNGLVTAQGNGVVGIVATAQDGSGVSDTMYVTVSEQNPSTQYAVISHFPVFTGSGTRSATIDAPDNEFVRLLFEGNVVASANYTVTQGSTVITLQENYLKTFANGTYMLRAEFTQGYVDLPLTIDVNSGGGTSGNGDNGTGNGTTGTTSAPKTGDDSNIVLYLSLCLASIGGAVVVVSMRRRKRA